MDSGCLIYDPSSSSRMLVLGSSAPNTIFRGPRPVLGIEDAVNRRRPFFTSPEDLLEEEYYDEQLPEKKRRLSPEQVQMLERSFESENKLEPERKSELAKKLGLQPRQVAVWFQNRRARWKTKQLERDFDRLRAAYDSLLADHESVLKDNDQLRSQVAALSEKLQDKELPAEAMGPAFVTGVPLETKVTGGTKVEDRLSTGSGGSAVVDGEGQQVVVDSCSPDSPYLSQVAGGFPGDCMIGPAGGVCYEDDRSDDGCNYLPAGAAAAFAEESNHDHDHDATDNCWWGVLN